MERERCSAFKVRPGGFWGPSEDKQKLRTLKAGREVSIFMAGDLDQDGQIGGRRSLYVE